MILNKFTKIHIRDKYQVLDIPLKSFITLEQSIRARGYVFTIFSTIIDSYTTCQYMHRSAICQQTMKMAPQIHPCISDCAVMLKIEEEVIGAFNWRDLLPVPEGHLVEFIK